MEALVAIGLAGSIVQFVDCGIRWVSNARQLYNNISGLSDENAELELVITDIEKLIPQLRNRAPGIGTDPEPELMELLVGSFKLAGELKHILQDLRVDPQKNHRAESITRSFKSLRKKSQIKDIERRLYRMRDQVCAHAVLLLRYNFLSLAAACC